MRNDKHRILHINFFRTKNKLKTIANKRKFFLIGSVIFIFPVVAGVIYNIPIVKKLNIETGALLGFYGTAFGIIGSFITYRNEIKKEKKRRNKELKPIFFVEIKKSNKHSDIFNLKIIKQSEDNLSYFYLYDEFISVIMKKECIIDLSFNKTDDEVEKLKTENNFYNITMDPDIIDNKDNFPKYIQIICDDIDGNSWNCCFNKVNDCGKIFYFPDEWEIL